MKKVLSIILVCAVAIGVSGCAVNFYKGHSGEEKQIKKLKGEVGDLAAAKKELEGKLAKEIADKQVLLELASRGLVIAMANDILFDSGKAKLKKESHSVLKKISTVLKEKTPDSNIGVEGHTDNVPIKYSGWKSNWELSTSRAMSVLHYLIDKCGVAPGRLSAIGYGEYNPIDTNDTKEGRAKNRRVEIVILPKETTKKAYEEAQLKISEEAKAKEESKIAAEAVK